VKTLALAMLAGALFALGLALGGMTVPARVTGFLAIGGAWDPGLAFVMIGAIAVHAPLQRLIRRRSAPLLAERFHGPTATAIDTVVSTWCCWRSTVVVVSVGPPCTPLWTTS